MTKYTEQLRTLAGEGPTPKEAVEAAMGSYNQFTKTLGDVYNIAHLATTMTEITSSRPPMFCFTITFLLQHPKQQ